MKPRYLRGLRVFFESEMRVWLWFLVKFERLVVNRITRKRSV